MKLTKYEHACVVLEDQGQRLIIDPGSYGALPTDVNNAVALVITHEHPDHFNPENIDKIKEQNPTIQIFASKEVAAQIKQAIIPKMKKVYHIGPFRLEFSGDMHAIIHPSYPSTHNLSVFINASIYYPGDVLLAPDRPANVLIMPLTAPWQKASEAMDFLTTTKAPLVIPVHEAILSEKYGIPLYDRLLSGAVKSYGGEYHRLKTGERWEIL